MNASEVALPRLTRRISDGTIVSITALTEVRGAPIGSPARPGDLIRFCGPDGRYDSKWAWYRGVVQSIDPPTDDLPAMALIAWIAPYARTALGTPTRTSWVAVPALVVIRRAR